MKTIYDKKKIYQQKTFVRIKFNRELIKEFRLENMERRLEINKKYRIN